MNVNSRENPISLKEKLNHILKSNLQPLNKSMNSDNSLKISGILEAIDDEPHYIHLNLEDFLKGSVENEKNSFVLSKANLERLNTINNKTSNEKRNLTKNNTIKKQKMNNSNAHNNNTKELNSKKIVNANNKNTKTNKNEENFEEAFQMRNKFLQNNNSLLIMLENNSKPVKKNEKENDGNTKKNLNLPKESKKNNFSNENFSKIRKKI